MKCEKRKRTDLEEKIYKGIKIEILKYYDNEGITYKNKEEPKDTIYNFFAYISRLIPLTKRHVHYSTNLINKINANKLTNNNIKILEMFENAFEIGNDMNGFLSNNIKDSKSIDFLRYTWHLFHLHMSEKYVEEKSQMKNNRSDTQLLCIIDLHDVYFIDVIPHPKKAKDYFNLDYLNIIIENKWMNKIGYYEMNIIPGSISPNITNEEDIFNIIRNGININFEFNQKGYLTIEPMNTVRNPIFVNDIMSEISKMIRAFRNSDESYIGFELKRQDDGVFIGVAKFRTEKETTKIYQLFNV